MAVYQLDDKIPQVHETAWIADSADVMGEVRLDRDASVWFGAVLRGDTELLHLGAGSNIQDASVVHADAGFPVRIGERVTVGHKVMLHGCTIGDESLIGIGAIILNGARIGRQCLVGAGALVTEGKEFPDGSMILGAPARVVRQLSAEQAAMLRQGADHYVENARRFRAGLKRLDAGAT
ncbi:MAG: gamma carbonic anhydrase family protein [Ottowia sp.]|nr:gamma carbonic anhydrase family protein [Ottowia sp.]